MVRVLGCLARAGIHNGAVALVPVCDGVPSYSLESSWLIGCCQPRRVEEGRWKVRGRVVGWEIGGQREPGHITSHHVFCEQKKLISCTKHHSLMSNNDLARSGVICSTRLASQCNFHIKFHIGPYKFRNTCNRIATRSRRRKKHSNFDVLEICPETRKS